MLVLALFLLVSMAASENEVFQEFGQRTKPKYFITATKAILIHRPLPSYNFSSGLFGDYFVLESYCPCPFSAVLSVLPPVSFVSINGSIIVVTMQWILTHNKTALKGLYFLNAGLLFFVYIVNI